MGHDYVVPLSPTSAESLVHLKTLLDQAISGVGTGGRLRTLTAVVLLDAANERAMHIAAHATGAEIRARTTFEEVAKVIIDSIGDRWPGDRWLAVRQLHRVRNIAQHEGVPADPDMLAGWAAATQQFVRSVVAAVFDVDLDEVTLADAIQAEDVAAHVRDAEVALAAGDAQRAVEAAKAAFDLARQRWLGLRPGRDIARPPIRWVTGERGSGDRWIEGAIQSLADASAVGVFAADPAEYLWFRSVALDRDVPPNLDEAYRAVGFVFWWVVRWDAFQATFVPDRRAAHLRQSRNVRTDASRASVESVELRGERDEYRADLKIRDVPTEEDFSRWSRLVGDLVRDGLDGKWCYVQDDGTLSIPVPHDADVGDIARVVDWALTEAERAVVEERETEARVAREAAAASQRFRDEVSGVSCPEWVDAVDLERDGSSRGTPRIVLRLNSTFASEHDVCEFLRARDDVESCYPTRDAVVLMPVLAPEHLARLLNEADVALRPAVEEAVQRHTAEAVEREQLTAALRRAFVR